jgi:uncharacterized protein
MDIFFKTWHWSISGFLIAIIMLTLNYFGKVFGMSTNLRSLCSIAGADKCADFFKFDWKSQRWNLLVVVGAMIGGYVAVNFMSDPTNVNIDSRTKIELVKMNIDLPNGKLLPNKIFGIAALKSPKMISILIIGGFLIGFGSRYAGGCTSGHAIAGLSNFQKQSLKAVVGFFIGGLIMAHFILPLIF